MENSIEFKSLEEAMEKLLGCEIKPYIPNSMLLPKERDNPKQALVAPLGLSEEYQPGNFIAITNKAISDKEIEDVIKKYYEPLGFKINPYEYGFKVEANWSKGLCLDIINESKDKGQIYITIWGA